MNLFLCLGLVSELWCDKPTQRKYDYDDDDDVYDGDDDNEDDDVVVVYDAW